MNKVKLAMMFSIVLCLLIVIPAGFAADNHTALEMDDESDLAVVNDTTVTTSSDESVLEMTNTSTVESMQNQSVLEKTNESMAGASENSSVLEKSDKTNLSATDGDSLGADYYFDSNAENDSGDGSPDKPYKNLNPSRMADNSNLHMADGVYDLGGASKTLNNVVIIGQSVENTIIKNAKFTVSNSVKLYNITLINVVVTNNANLLASNVIFANSTSAQGGAIYSKGTTNIDNCTFSNNKGEFGGAIYSQDGNLSIFNSRFINNEASIFGGAVTALSSNLNFTNITARGNKAKYYGGAIYSLYGSIALTYSLFYNNSAQEGGAIFIDAMNPCNISGNFFSGNNASYVGAAYILDDNVTCFENNTFYNNTADYENDTLQTTIPNLKIGDGDYILINADTSDFNGTLPSKYDLRELGYVTPVKNQGSGGNCWAFSTYAALESCILKASGIAYDFSEENMKNLMAKYSDYGWPMTTNKGGYDDMGIAYLISWLGPVNETDDVYEASSLLSPVLHSFYHVQNVLFITRDNYADNDGIKQAVMKYGAVSTSIYWVTKYRKGSSYYCYDSVGLNHAVAIVGWDDNYSKDNFVKPAPADGAWIIKNSWGTGSGENGFYYVSYYDTSCAQVGRNDLSYTFILNDTVKFDRNYQYDIQGRTDFFLNSSSTVWYKNVFTSDEDEYLAAVSTQFQKQTNYTVSVYVNDVLKIVQNGTAGAGYYTINLNEFIPLNRGDVFEVVFKITVDGEAAFPISEDISLNKCFYTENVSYVSYDGENWTDLYNLSWKYSSHTYYSQVACLKAFTFYDLINTTTQLSIVNGTEYNVVAKVLNQYNRPVTTGYVNITVNGITYTVKVSNGYAILKLFGDSGIYNISAVFAAVGHISSQDNISVYLPQVNTTVSLDILSNHNPVTVVAHITNQYGLNVDCGNVTFEIEGEFYTVNVTDGIALINHTFKNPGKYNISAVFNSIYYYKSSQNTSGFDIYLTNTTLSLNISNCYNPVNITAVVKDQFGRVVTTGNVTFMIENQPYTVNIINGSASIEHIFVNIGNNDISATFKADGYYSSNSSISEYIYSDKEYLELTVTKTDLFDVKIEVRLSKTVNGTVTLTDSLNGKTYSVTVKNGVGQITLTDQDYGKHGITAKSNSEIYYCEDVSGSFTIDYIKTTIKASNVEIYFDETYKYKVTLVDANNNPVSGKTVMLTINKKQLFETTNSNGVASFAIECDPGSYKLDITFDTSGIYYKSSSTKTLEIKSTVILPSSVTYTFNSKYTATLIDSNGNPVKNKQIRVSLDGIRFFNLNTDSKGKFSFNIDLNPDKYFLVITNPATGQVESPDFKVVKRITQNSNIKMYYGAGKSYKVKVFNDYGKIAKSVSVKFKINGKTYSKKTNSKGFAYFKITQKPGTYTITATYKGYKVSNKVVVKSTIITKNLNVKKGKTIKFKAKLLNSKGKVLKGKKITFKFKGKTYYAKTNGKGMAIVKIKNKFKVGKYTIASKYGKLTVKNTIRIKN